jgi:hypothetical protein
MSVLIAFKNRTLISLSTLLILGCFQSVLAQSLDARTPSPIRTNEIVGRIGARDLGDSRLTDHFYAFTGIPGDLVVTIEAQNLNGDIDIFTAGALRPVLKVSLYAEVNAPVIKSVFLRHQEDLILRVEARSPNDDDGTYHISFGGSFQPVAGLSAEEQSAAGIASAPPATRKGKRVSSVGARIEAPSPPPLEVAEGPTPEPTSAETMDPPPAEPRVAETPPAVAASSPEARVKTAEPKTEAPEPSTSRSARTPRARASARRAGRSRVPAPEAEKKPPTEELAKETEEKPAAEGSKPVPEVETASKPEVPAKKSSKKSRRAVIESEAADTESSTAVTEPARAKEAPVVRPKAKRTSTAAPAEEPATPSQPEDLSHAKLIIEMVDGARIERLMSTIRRVDMESGEIVVTALDGTVSRIRLSRVLRMSIGR